MNKDNHLKFYIERIDNLKYLYMKNITDKEKYKEIYSALFNPRINNHITKEQIKESDEFVDYLTKTYLENKTITKEDIARGNKIFNSIIKTLEDKVK
jgi:hypothetical protein